MRCGVIPIGPLRPPGRHLPFWVRRVSQFRLVAFTAFQMGVPLVSIDRKGSALSPVWLGDAAHCPQASYPRLCRNQAHAAYPSHHYSHAALNEQHHLSLKGTLGDMQKSPKFMLDFSFQHMIYSFTRRNTGGSMAGKKAFEPQRVLEKAMHAFWEHGYEGISIEDLVQSTGIGRGSLYGTFEDKHSLYLAALDQYVAAVKAQTITLLDQEGALHEVLQQLFHVRLEPDVRQA